MLPPTINKHKAVWASSIAIFTLGAVVYFTVYRNSKESSSKPSKKPIQDREIVHKEKKQIDEETSKGRDISNQVDVSQVKATVTLEETDSNQVTSDQQIKVTETEKDAATTTETNTMTTTTTTTAIETSDNNNNDELTESIVQINHQDVKLNDSFVMVSQSTDEKKPSTEQEEDDEIEKSPLLTAAPSSSSSSDIASQPDQESKVIVKPTPAPSTTTSQQDLVKEIKKEKQQDEIKKKSMAATTTPSVRSATTANHLQQQQQQQQHMMMNVNNTNGMYINGYWHAPTATTTFQHSMGWPELFPLQQQQQHNNNNSNNNEMNQHVTTLDESTMDEAALKKYNQKEKKRSNKKKMTRLEQIDQQKQNYVPSMKSRCNWWPNCTNKNCKYFHPHQPCRYGDLCIYNERCMFLHPWDYEESYK